jgi:hypothetical protein
MAPRWHHRLVLNPTAPPAPPRRLVLRGLAGVAGLAALASCDVRLESDAPVIPVLRRQEAVDERLLLGLLGAIGAIHHLATTAVTSSAAERSAASAVAAACAAQRRTVVAGLVSEGVPPEVIRAASPTGAPSAEAAAAAAGMPALWAAQAQLVTERVADPATIAATSAHRALVASILTHHAASASLGAAPPRWPHERLPSAAAAIALEQIRAVRYGLTVAAAHLSGAVQARVMRLDAALHRAQMQVREQAGGAAGAAPPAYHLPVAVTSEATATRLIRSVVADLQSGVLSPLDALPPASPGLVAVIRHASGLLVLATPWSGPLTPLPGLQV